MRRFVTLALLIALSAGAGWFWRTLPPAVAITLAGHGTVLVPPTALRDGAVFIVRRETVERRAVETGPQGPYGVEIPRGIAADEAVVVNPPPGLMDGQVIRLRP